MALDTKIGKKPEEKRVTGFVSFNSGSVDQGGLPVSEPTYSPGSMQTEPALSKPDKPDVVNSPAHYARLQPQPIEVIVAWKLNYLRGTAIKYLARAGFKDGTDQVDDLRKAASFINREISLLTGGKVVA